MSSRLQVGSLSGHSCLRPCCSCTERADLHFGGLRPPSALPPLYVALPPFPWLFSQSTHDFRSGTCGSCHVSLGEGVGGSWRDAAPLYGLWRPTPLWAVRPQIQLLVLHPHPASTSSVTRGNCTWWTVVCCRRVFSRHRNRNQVGASLWPQEEVLGKPWGYATPIYRSSSLFPAISSPDWLVFHWSKAKELRPHAITRSLLKKQKKTMNVIPQRGL